MGAEALEIDYKTNVQLAHDTFKDKITFVGNIDPSEVIARGTPETVKARTNELLDVFQGYAAVYFECRVRDSGGYAPGNIRAMCGCLRGRG